MRILKTLALGAVFAIGASAAMADKLPLGSISKYLNAMSTAKGEFTQINNDGTISTGTIYIKRPGRVRFAGKLWGLGCLDRPTFPVKSRR